MTRSAQAVIAVLILCLTIPVGIITNVMLGPVFDGFGSWSMSFVFSAYAAAMAVLTQLDHFARDRGDRRYSLVPTALMGVVVMLAVTIVPQGLAKTAALLAASFGIEALVVGYLVYLVSRASLRTDADAGPAY